MVNPMNTAAIVLVSIFSGAFLIVIVGALAALIYLHVKAAKRDALMLDAMEQHQLALGSLVEEATTQMMATIESAKASFTGIRKDIKESQTTQETALVKSLMLHDKAFQETMARINPIALEAASAKILHATGSIAKVASTLQALLVTHDVPEAGADLLPEEYGPSDTVYAKQSDSARMDQALERMETEENAPMYEGSIA